MKITICIGSSCHVKGSREVVEKFEELIRMHYLEEKVTLHGTFCIGNCKNGVCVTLDEQDYSLSPDGVEEFFATQVLPRVGEA